MEELIVLLNTLESQIPQRERLNPAVSKVSVGWHIQHALLVGIKTIEAMAKSDPKDYQWSFSFSKTLVYSLNKIPRGKGRAPKAVQPEDIITEEQLRANIQLAKEYVKKLSVLHAHSHFKHPYFGKLHVKSTTKFLRLHTKHHLGIIRDIVAGK